MPPKREASNYRFNELEQRNYSRLTTEEQSGYMAYVKDVLSQTPGASGSRNMLAWTRMDQRLKNHWIAVASLQIGEKEYEEEDTDAEEGNKTMVGVESRKDPVEVEDCEEMIVGASPTARHQLADENHINTTIDAETAIGGVPNLKWRFVKSLYKRSAAVDLDFESTNCLFFGLDKQGTARDRIVVKSMWMDDWETQNDLETTSKIAERFKEFTSFFTQRGHNSGRGRPPIGRGTRYWFRAYSEYCQHGNLSDVISRYGEASSKDNNYDQIPEFFIWLLARNLAEAICIMHASHSDTKQLKNRRRWEGVLHRDFKTSNIFLAEPLGPYLAFPNPVLGDFDTAVNVGDVDASYHGYLTGVTGVEEGENAAGTSGWMAPETLYSENIPEDTIQGPQQNAQSDNESDDYSNFQDTYTLRAGEKPWPSYKTDIWGLGMVLFHMINSTAGRQTLRAARNDPRLIANLQEKEGDIFHPDLLQRMNCNARYSPELKHLVNMCLKINPDHRPEPADMLGLIIDEMERWEYRSGSAKGYIVGNHLKLRYKEDVFVLGASYAVKRRKSDENLDNNSNSDSGDDDSASD